MSAASRDAVPVTRDMRDDDVPRVAELEKASYDFPWSPSIFYDCIRVGYRCCVLEDIGGIAGYSILACAAGEAHLLNLCVREDLRRRGMGAWFLDLMLHDARRLGAQRMFLEVRPSNRAALRLYVHNGFRRIGLRKRYYRAVDNGSGDSREDALVLAITLDDAVQP